MNFAYRNVNGTGYFMADINVWHRFFLDEKKYKL